MICSRHIFKNKGSLENDGRSDVNDSLELKIFKTHVTPTAVAPIAVIL